MIGMITSVMLKNTLKLPYFYVYQYKHEKNLNYTHTNSFYFYVIIFQKSDVQPRWELSNLWYVVSLAIQQPNYCDSISWSVANHSNAATLAITKLYVLFSEL